MLSILIAGCIRIDDSKGIVKIVDFQISPDEDKIAFSAITPAGNIDIWVIDIDSTNLKRLTFKDRSPSNHMARFFKKHKWRNFYEIDMHSAAWTKDGRIMFCQELTEHHKWGIRTVSSIYWTIKPDGTDKKRSTSRDEAAQRRPFDPINSPDISDFSEKHKKKIFIKDDTLYVLGDGSTTPKRLIR
jgi:hypothetical protein